ncbi:MAG: hypothetical protein ACFFG0_48520 [Candidatus Thorarchaeota archaeon]
MAKKERSPFIKQEVKKLVEKKKRKYTPTGLIKISIIDNTKIEHEGHYQKLLDDAKKKIINSKVDVYPLGIMLRYKKDKEYINKAVNYLKLAEMELYKLDKRITQKRIYTKD